MTSVLLTGASGVVGTWLRRLAPEDITITALTHRRRVAGPEVVADIRDAAAVTAAVADTRPALVVHAAYVMNDELAIVGGTRNVARAAAAVGAAVLHLSTDVVFGGDGRLRAETDEPDPITLYGRLKVAAEAEARSAVPDTAIVRLPLLTSLDPPDESLVRMRAGSEARTPTVWFVDECRHAAAASDIAAGIWRIAALDRTARAGVWQLPGPEVVSRWDLARRATRADGLDARWIRGEPTPPHLTRPRDVRLGADRALAEIGWSPGPAYG